jgi:hypothetical protein
MVRRSPVRFKVPGSGRYRPRRDRLGSAGELKEALELRFEPPFATSPLAVRTVEVDVGRLKPKPFREIKGPIGTGWLRWRGPAGTLRSILNQAHITPEGRRGFLNRAQAGPFQVGSGFPTIPRYVRRGSQPHHAPVPAVSTESHPHCRPLLEVLVRPGEMSTCLSRGPSAARYCDRVLS